MKKILGLDLGTTSIGWAVVNEAENDSEKSSIVKIGVRVNPLTTDEKGNFEKGKSITTNADRTLKRSMRRNNQRYKLRREYLIACLKDQGWITDDTVLAEQGNATTFQTLRLRAKAATEEISLEELARVLLSINKKRGYKSSRKVQSDDEGQIVDGMEIAKILYDKSETPGQYVYYECIANGKYHFPEFYRSDLKAEFEKIWKTQRQFYSDALTDELRETLDGKNKGATWKICEANLGVVGMARKAKGKDLIKENYEWRVKALSEQLDLEQLTIVFQEINGQLSNSSGCLGNISDRSKELFFSHQTVGQYLMNRLDENPNCSLKNLVFYRQDYIDEFETIWHCQSRFHPELTAELEKELKNSVIFYQRPLKSQKDLVSLCELESHEILVNGKMRLIGPKVCPKSSPIFQEFRIWQNLGNIKFGKDILSLENKQILANELAIRADLSASEALKLLGISDKSLKFKKLEGNRLQSELFNAYAQIIEQSGHGEYDFSKMPAKRSLQIVKDVFTGLGFKTDFLHFDSSLPGDEFEKQSAFRLWHLLYSYQGDNSITGNDSLVESISALCAMPQEYAKIIANVHMEDDYGSLSTRAMRKLLPFMKQGDDYSEAAAKVYGTHSKRSLTKEELDNKELKDRLDLLPKNSLRNPVVEKILNQMINVVNSIIEEYGKPDEIRIELARELKKSQQERKDASSAISKSTARNEEIRQLLESKFGMEHPSQNDILRYKLWNELKVNGYKTLYTGTKISEEELFSKNYDIEHIIPQSRLFDDSFANKTLEARWANIEKGNATAIDFVKTKYGSEGVEEYKSRVKALYDKGIISKTKYSHLIMTGSEIPEGFIERDLRDSQYIAKKAREILEGIVREVVTTTGSVTDRLREDWQLVDVMQELNWDKYDKLGLTYSYQDKDGRTIRKISDWTKRNDHRHHAMDALTIAFTKRSYVQYLNHLNARVDKIENAGQDDEYKDLRYINLGKLPKDERTCAVRAIEYNQLRRDSRGKLRFLPPMPLDEFRAQAKDHVEHTLISIKAKNKVATRNDNVSKANGDYNHKIQLTPRGQLHNETVYGLIYQYDTKKEKVGSAFTLEKISTVANQTYKQALLDRLVSCGNDPKKAFTGKNSLEKNPIYLDELHTSTVPIRITLVTPVYTIRKPVDPNLNVDKVLDRRVRVILKQRLYECGGDSKKAFSNLDENPIWLNKEKGIVIKRVTITGVNNVSALHDKRDNLGNLLRDAEGNTIPTDYVSTCNNHHVAIFMDEQGNVQEQIVSFFEANQRINSGLPVIEKNYKKSDGWSFLFTMKQNEYFVFPNEVTGFDPKQIDLTDSRNYDQISPNLYRVQKLASKDYTFRHHLETNVNNVKSLQNIAWKRITAINTLRGVVKVRVNHIGQIVQVGEY